MRNLCQPLVLLLLVLPLSASAQSAPPISPQEQRIELSLADLLEIYGKLSSLEFARELDPELFTRFDIVLLNTDGRTVFDLVLTEKAGREMQAEGAGEATKLLQEFHLAFVRQFLSQEARRESDEGKKYLRTPDSPAKKAVRAWLKTRTERDFLTLVRFERGKKTHVYATVDDGGARFNPDAPAP